jgi:hypothetical protein
VVAPNRRALDLDKLDQRSAAVLGLDKLDQRSAAVLDLDKLDRRAERSISGPFGVGRSEGGAEDDGFGEALAVDLDGVTTR